MNILTTHDFRLATLLALAIGVFLVPPLVHIHERALPIGIVFGITIITLTIIFCNALIFAAGHQAHRFPTLFTFTKFFLTGAFNTAFDISIVNVLSFSFSLYRGIPLVIASVFSFCIVLLFSYFINRSWSFNSRGTVSEEFYRFTTASILSFAINISLLYILTTTIGAPRNMPEAIWVNIVKLLTAVISMVLNFSAFHLFVFKERNQQQELLKN